MKVIKDNYNKQCECPHCKSIIGYNEGDVEDEYVSVMYPYGHDFWTNKVIKCPLCGETIKIGRI